MLLSPSTFPNASSSSSLSSLSLPLSLSLLSSSTKSVKDAERQRWIPWRQWLLYPSVQGGVNAGDRC
ncbi:hypothetical protein POPTR_014G194201v4 [Populus trichocarpa]|uniref:Uncharacterized protein n=1 Tax=Populus trichocarpa TaxID=3694 RepID=A0ACC0S036_POPTR|nr:hypothetical protein POPTR_014G194201v4 [Populus trichocarpa]